MTDKVTGAIKHAVMGHANDKIDQLKANMVEPNENTRITSDWGVKQNDTDHWLRVATEDQTGPSLLEDSFAREKIHRFDHERIPERVVHARGAGAHGTFRLFESAADVTSAPVLTDTSRETPIFIRFSTVLGSRGSADTVRDVRGFAIKFYTQEGWSAPQHPSTPAPKRPNTKTPKHNITTLSKYYQTES
ncbi:catalase-1 [Fusarium heterosporum]|uniref:catalase n=1 Tax=Fusarium heterosporum TaxID=42747 RepID=A0A8H5SVQ0_FUSHE|nr:catalase-1 [Fusarium heterosporum]